MVKQIVETVEKIPDHERFKRPGSSLENQYNIQAPQYVDLLDRVIRLEKGVFGDADAYASPDDPTDLSGGSKRRNKSKRKNKSKRLSKRKNKSNKRKNKSKRKNKFDKY